MWHVSCVQGRCGDSGVCGEVDQKGHDWSSDGRQTFWKRHYSTAEGMWKIIITVFFLKKDFKCLFLNTHPNVMNSVAVTQKSEVSCCNLADTENVVRCLKADFWGAETFSLFNCTVVLCVLKGWNRLCRFWDWPHSQRGSSSDASVRWPKTPQWCSLCNFLTYFIMSYDFLLDSISSWMYFYFAGKCFHWLYNTDLLKLPSKCFLHINVNNFL